jgi:hypothetical protein
MMAITTNNSISVNAEREPKARRAMVNSFTPVAGAWRGCPVFAASERNKTSNLCENCREDGRQPF